MRGHQVQKLSNKVNVSEILQGEIKNKLRDTSRSLHMLDGSVWFSEMWTYRKVQGNTLIYVCVRVCVCVCDVVRPTWLP